MAGAAVTAATALVLAACNGGGTGDDPDSEPADDDGGDTSAAADTSLTIGWNQSFYEYNNNSRTGNATANAIILHLMNDGFRYYDQDLNLVHNDDSGTYGITEEDEDGITVEFVVNEGKYWYGGEEPVPVDAADLMLAWAAHSGHVNTLDSDEAVMEQVEEELIGDYAEEGEDGEWEFPDEETEAEFEAEVQEVAAERLADDNQVFFNGVLPTSIGLIEETPEIIEDGRGVRDRKSTRLNSSHVAISYAVFCLKKKRCVAKQ